MELVHALVVGDGEKDIIVLHGFLGMETIGKPTQKIGLAKAGGLPHRPA